MRKQVEPGTIRLAVSSMATEKWPARGLSVKYLSHPDESTTFNALTGDPHRVRCLLHAPQKTAHGLNGTDWNQLHMAFRGKYAQRFTGFKVKRLADILRDDDFEVV